MRSLCLAFFSAAAFSPSAIAQLPHPIFADVPQSKNYYNQVNMMRERLITYGCTVIPAQYCPDWTVTRGQAAVLIIRSIYSARNSSGDPEDFTYPSNPYFTDIQPEHEQFKYIQKMKELGITSGLTPTTYDAGGSLSFSQMAVFSYRARRIRNGLSLDVPAPCSGDLFADVPATHIFCPYIREMFWELGMTAISPYCYSGFCPDSIAMPRGILAFYLVDGVLNASYPHLLPTSNGELPAVSTVSTPYNDCASGLLLFGNDLYLFGSQIFSWGGTSVETAANNGYWTMFTDLALRTPNGNPQVLYSGSYQTGSGEYRAELGSPNFTYNANLNYENRTYHSWASSCLPNGFDEEVDRLNNPVLFSTNAPVLYRGTTQQVSFRGSTLQNVYFASLQSSSLGTSDIIASQFQATLNITTPINTPAGNAALYLGTVPYNFYPGQTNTIPVAIADPTPTLTSITPNSGTQGSPPISATLYGANFGSNPTVCILVSVGNCVQSFGGVTVTRGFCGVWPSCNTQIPITITIDSNAAVISYQIAVVSYGANGLGFQSGGGSQPTPPAPVLFYVQAAPTGTVRLNRFGWGNNQELWKAQTFASNGDTVIGPVVWQNALLNQGEAIDEPVALRAGSDTPYLANVTLQIDPAISSNAELQVTVSPSEFSFQTVPFAFTNGIAAISGIPLSTAMPNRITSSVYQFTWRVRLTPSGSFQTVAVTNHTIFLMKGYFTNTPNTYRATTKRLQHVVNLASGLSPQNVDSIVLNVLIQLDSTPGFDNEKHILTPNNVWAALDRTAADPKDLELDCESLSGIAAAQLQQLGFLTVNVGTAYPTGGLPLDSISPPDTNALTQETRVVDGYYYSLLFGGDAYEGYLYLLPPDVTTPRAFTVAPLSTTALDPTTCTVTPSTVDNRLAYRVLINTYRLWNYPPQRWGWNRVLNVGNPVVAFLSDPPVPLPAINCPQEYP